jgi:serine/threonine-protein kinase OSR1/STK39
MADDIPQPGSHPHPSAISPQVISGTSGTETVPTTNLWPAEEKQYKFMHLIGQGATSKVYAAECLPTAKKCAIKIINLENCSSNDGLKEINREIASMKRLKHENIVAYYTSFLNVTKLEIVMDICEKGSLLDIIKAVQATRGLNQGVFDENTIATILRDVLRGLSYIHDNDLVHRDLKCGNLLVRNDAYIQIADFGVTAFLNTIPMLEGSVEAGMRRTFVGTPCWMAPEVMNQMTRHHVQGYNWKADIWSLGITCIELATGQAPYARYAPFKVLMMTLQNEAPTVDTCASYPNQYENYGQKFRKFCRTCLVKDPAQRASTKELLQHSYIKSKCKDRDFLQKMLLSGNLPTPQPPQTGAEETIGGAEVPSNIDAEWEFPPADNVDEAIAKAMAANNLGGSISPKPPENPTPSNVSSLAASSNADKQKQDPLSAQQKAKLGEAQAADSRSGVSSSLKPSAQPSSQPAQIYKITLMKRNHLSGNELQNISFSFVVGQDSSNALSNDLVENDLLERSNFLLVAHKIDELVANPSLKEKCFPLYTTPPNGIPVSEQDMQGYAKLSIAPWDEERDKDLL